MDSEQNIVNIRKISKTYHRGSDSNTVLHDFSMKVKPGGINVILGPTGCGKTTLLNMIAGIIEPDEGDIEYADIITGKNIRCVFQHYTLFPWLKIIQNVTFGLEMQKVPLKERREKATAMLASIGLKSFKNHYPHELSGGMRQRTAIAQALVTNPKLLLMDEPFGALDDRTRLELQNLLLKLHDNAGLTTIFVTHSIDEALKLGDRIILLSEQPAKISEDIILDWNKNDYTGKKRIDEIYLKIRDTLHNLQKT